jgi:hypothetical protein
MAKIPVAEMVKICRQIVEIKKDTDAKRMEFEHAKQMIQEVVEESEGIINILSEIMEFKNKGKIKESEFKSILFCINKLYKERIEFENTCLNLLSKNS